MVSGQSNHGSLDGRKAGAGEGGEGEKPAKIQFFLAIDASLVTFFLGQIFLDKRNLRICMHGGDFFKMT